MLKLTLKTVADFVGADCPSGCESIEIDELCRDSRAAGSGSLFVPLPGTRFEGHDFIAKAAENGASATLASRAGEYPLPTLVVDDVLAACQAIAAGYKAQFARLATVGVTGSAGKTTTTKMTACVLGTKYRLLTTQEDNNGQQGLTFALYGIDEQTDVALVEMGMSLPGEMHRLSVMARPDIAVINGIGRAHIEFFGSRENILKAKLEILDGMASDARLVLNGDDDLLWGLRGTLPQSILYYGIENRDCDIIADMISTNAESSVFAVHYRGETVQATLPAAGTHNILDALAAVGVGLWMDVALADACAALAGFVPARGRENIYRKNGFTIIDDCYNASPEAVKASIGVMAGLDGGRKIVCLGDMLELGDHAPAAHAECGAFAAKRADYLVACGPLAMHYVEGARGAGMKNTAHFTDRVQAAAYLAELARTDDVLLFKGSHGAHIEQVLSAFLEKTSETT